MILDPVGCYVIKTTNIKTNEKVFVNVCTDNQIPAPEILDAGEIAVSVSKGNDWTVPIVVSAGREDVDKSGKQCTVYDCCMNPEVVRLGIEDPSIKVLTVETCIEIVEDRDNIALSREFKFPKMKSKGNLANTEYDANAPVKKTADNNNKNLGAGEDSSLPYEVSSNKKDKKISIEVIESKDTPTYYFHVYKASDSLYNFNGAQPSHVIEIYGLHDDITFDHNSLPKISSPKLGTLKLPFSVSRYLSYYNESEEITYIFIWKK